MFRASLYAATPRVLGLVLLVSLCQYASAFLPNCKTSSVARLQAHTLNMAAAESLENMRIKLPKATPMPPPILSNVPGTWAYDTMSRRVRDDILSRIYAENPLDTDASLAGVKAGLDKLKAELTIPQQSSLPPIGEDGGPDVKVWGALMRDYEGSNWLDAPWLVTEFYFYRRVAEIFRYFKSGYDCFSLQKRLGLTGSASLAKDLAHRTEDITEGADPLIALRFAVFASLWGNKMDLSLWPSQSDADNKAATFASVLDASSANLLSDDFEQLAAHLTAHRGGRVDIVVDNAGFELITDLFLADCLLRQGYVTKVVLHTKGHPTFVSDAMDKDVRETVAFLQEQGLACADRWAGYLDSGAWELHAHTYWAQPFAFWHMPSDIIADLQKSTLCFIKGDANYRRLLGDREWPLSLPFGQVVSYWPCPVAPLRTLKAELGCGMAAEKVQAARERDPKDWMVTGKYGVVQFQLPE